VRHAHLVFQVEHAAEVEGFVHVFEGENDLVFGVNIPYQNALGHGAAERHLHRALQIINCLLF